MMGGDLVILGGRPGQGKSTLLDSIAMNLMTEHKKRVGFFTLEMSAKQVNARFVTHLSGIPAERILKGRLEDREWPSFTHAIVELEHLPFIINDKSGLTVPQLRVSVKRMYRELGGMDLIIVDYAQLMKASKKYRNRNEEIGEITKGLKEIAKELDVPILAAAQMSRAVDQRSDKRPILSDLRESGDLENDADIVLFIHRPDQYEKDGKQNVAEIIVAKHRNGPVGSVELIFRGALTKFENACTKNFSPNAPHPDHYFDGSA
jgi:replicative DNA helicase